MGKTLRQPGAILQNTYRLGRIIGSGSMGTVFTATHQRLPRKFAIKFLSESIAHYPDAVARFRREAEVTSRIGHPNIVEVVDFNQDDEGVPYIVMERLKGEDLAARIARVGRMNIVQVCQIVFQAASALQAAHAAGIVHRDLKPTNLFLTRTRDATDVVKVLDFGISKVLGAQTMMTGSDAFVGTPAYMSPEQAKGDAAVVDQRADIFSLGVIVYEMLAGKTPFAASSVPGVLYKIVHEQPASVLQICPNLAPEVETVLFQALAKLPEQRYPSIWTFSRWLHEAAGVEHRTDPEFEFPDDETEISNIAEIALSPTHSAESPLSLAQTLVAQKAPSPPTPVKNAVATPHAAPGRIAINRVSDPYSSITEVVRPSKSRLVWIAAAIGLVGVMMAGVWGLVSRRGKPTASAVVASPGPSAPTATPVSVIRVDAGQEPGQQPKGDAAIVARPQRVTAPQVAAPRVAQPTPPIARRSRPTGRSTLVKSLPAKPSAPGSLRVLTKNETGKSMWAEIYLDGKLVGQSPVYIPVVAAGRHTLEAKRPGYQPARQLLRIISGETSVKVINLSP